MEHECFSSEHPRAPTHNYDIVELDSALPSHNSSAFWVTISDEDISKIDLTQNDLGVIVNCRNFSRCTSQPK